MVAFMNGNINIRIPPIITPVLFSSISCLVFFISCLTNILSSDSDSVDVFVLFLFVY